MLKKTPIKKTNMTSVTFAFAGRDEAGEVGLAGEFNDWEPATTPMKRRKDGSWAVTMRLPRDERFEYRFVVDGKTWVADEEADELVPNPYGGKNSVCDLKG
jgi:1,4-alpha-glucan branching enzyme